MAALARPRFGLRLTRGRLQSDHFSENIMQGSTALHTTGIQAWSIADHWPALAVLMFGLVVLYGVGFATLPRVHNAAHDMRHANGFPCH
jgi:cobalt transporter subunit CbtB